MSREELAVTYSYSARVYRNIVYILNVYRDWWVCCDTKPGEPHRLRERRLPLPLSVLSVPNGAA